jgi:hypothetical protein
MKNHSKALFFSLLAGAGIAVADDDDYTNIHSPSMGEANHAQILSNALGGTFSASGLDFSNGSISAIRNRDSGYMNNNDQIWSAGTYNAKIIGNEGTADATFGYLNGNSGGHFQTLLDAEDIGSMASTTRSDDFRWAIKVDGFIWDHVYTSRERDNYGKDMMVSYSLYNASNSIIGSVLFFEDKKYHSDKDFNDVAVLLSIVPIPHAAAMGGLTLLAGISMTRRRRLA